MSLSACALLKTADKKEHSRTIAGLSPYKKAKAGAEAERRQKQALSRVIHNIKTGKAVVSKAVVVRNNRLVCGMDLRNQRNLVPGFAQPAPGNFRSALTFKRGVRACGANETRPIAQKVSQNRFVLEGTQTAFAPLVLMGAGAVIGCAMGVMAPFETLPDYMPTGAGRGALAGVAGGSAALLLGMGKTGFGTATTALGAFMETVVIGGAIGGATGGILGVILCGTATFIIENKGFF